MFRHVVLFRWSSEASVEAREGGLSALREWAVTAAELGTVEVGADAGLVPDNADVAVVGDFTDADAYRRYAEDPRHVALVRDVLRPLLAQRTAVQYHR